MGRTAVLLLVATTLPQQGVSQTTLGRARFTVISDSLIRLELGTPHRTGDSGSGGARSDAAGVAVAWDERPTLSYPGGRPVSEAAHTIGYPSRDVVTITTSHLLLRYDRSATGATW